ncbi:MAG: class I SAM-dependent methyltransferase [Nitrospirota bacterium]
MDTSAQHSFSARSAAKAMIQRILRRFGYALYRADMIEYLKTHQCPWVPAGHFYSPHADLDEIRRHEQKIFSRDKPILGIDLRESDQLSLLHAMASLQPRIEFPQTQSPGFRYYFDNPAFSYSDALVLHAMLRLIRPQRIIEVGCGYSSAMALDTNELCLGNTVQMTFVEPYPQLLYTLMKPGDDARVTIVPSRLQDLDPDFFLQLDANDILFIDSTHVSKVNSDVNCIFFEILPRLKAGVYIHFHDVFYPFEYVKEWVYEGRAWQELYLLRAFLQDNPLYQIVYFQDFLFSRHRRYFEDHLPLFLKNSGGNIWLRKVE